MPTPDDPAADVQASVLALLRDWVGQDAASLDRFVRAVADDFTGIGTAPREYLVGRDALRALTERERAEMPYPFTLDVPRLETRALGPGWALAEGELAVEVRAEGETFVEAPRFTLVLAWREGRWALVHFHMSVADAMQREGDTMGDLLATRNRELEREVARRTAELAAALDDLRAAQARLVHQEKMAALGRLTAGVAHEIKNPLNFVTNFADLSAELVAELAAEADPAERAALAADLADNVAKIGEHGRRADAVVRSMMDHARSGTGRRRPVDLRALVGEAVDRAAHARQAQEPDADVRVARDLADVGEVEVVPDEVSRVVVNLLGNAFDAVAGRPAGPDAPGVRVALRRRGDAVEVRVEDDGPGMDEAVRAQAFDPFFTTKPPGRGTGLGLSISHDVVVEGHGGTLALDSAPGRGTSAVVTLPASAG